MDLRLNIQNITPEAKRFIDVFNDGNDYVEVKTSGSTGVPKVIRLPKRDMIRSAEASCKIFGIDSRSRLVCPLSAEYIAGKMMIVRAMVSGAELFMETPSNKPLTMDYGSIDLLPVVPSQLVCLLSDTFKAEKIKTVIVGGGPVPANLLDKVKSASFHAFATYGMTETSSHVAIRDLRRDEAVFTALPGISFETDADSCLKVSAPEFSFDGIQTNDVVNLIDEKSFGWVGRRDNVIITGGVKVHIEEIEQKIAPLMNGEYYIVGVPDEFWGQKVVLYTVKEINPDSLRSVLTKYELPKEIRMVKEMQYTPTGKIRRLIL